MSETTAQESTTSNSDDKKEQFERNFANFLQLKNLFPTKTTCTSIYERFTNKLSNGISNYHFVIKNNIKESNKELIKDNSIKDNLVKDNSIKDNSIKDNLVKDNFIKDNTNNLIKRNGNLKLNFNDNNSMNDCLIEDNSIDTNQASKIISNNLNRNITARCSSRSNIGFSNINKEDLKLNKLTKEPLSTIVNAQCLSPRPRPRDLNMKVSTTKKSQPIGTLNTSLVSRNNFMKINGQDYAIDEGDFRYIVQLGAGTCGTVNKMEHIKSKAIVAVKEMTRSSHPEDNKRINMDLEVLLKCNNVEHIVQCYGYLIKGSRVWIIMELMTTCLDKLLKKINQPFPEPICGKIAVASIKSLDYLKTQHMVIHRDVKPSNILINSDGEIKLCDFGVSGRLVDSYAKTKQGCEAYMAPERILPPDPNKPSYDIRADVWSLGLTIVQLALNKYPYQNCRGDFEILTKILESDPPLLPDNNTFSTYFREFIRQCLEKDVKKRPKYKYLKWDPFYIKYDRENVDVKAWFNKVYFQS